MNSTNRNREQQGSRQRMENDRSQFNSSYGRRPQGLSEGYREGYGRYDEQFDDRDRYNQGQRDYDGDFGLLENDAESYRPANRPSPYDTYRQGETDRGRERNRYPLFAEDYQSDRQSSPNFRGVGPKGYRRSDDRIKEDVSDRLTDDSAIDASNLSIDVRDGEVILKGKVEDRHTKRLAEDCCLSVSGVDDVINEIRVRSASKGQGSGETESSKDKKGRKKKEAPSLN